MEPVGWVVVALAIVGGALAIDRLALWAEARGWIYWRRRRPSSSSLGSAMLSLQAFLEPTRDHVVEERRRQEADIDVAADDDPLGRDGSAPG